MKHLLQARDRIPIEKKARMVLKDRNGEYFHVWIARNQSFAAAALAGPE